MLAGGRVTNPAESRYSPIEGECLAFADTLHKAKHYLLNCDNLLLSTDHKPLVGVFAKNLEDIENPRLLSIAEKTKWFKFTTIHVPGKLDNGPDYMSRYSGEHIDASHLSSSVGVFAHVHVAGHLLPAQDVMQVEEGMSICKYFEVGRISTYGQQIDDAFQHESSTVTL